MTQLFLLGFSFVAPHLRKQVPASLDAPAAMDRPSMEDVMEIQAHVSLCFLQKRLSFAELCCFRFRAYQNSSKSIALKKTNLLAMERTLFA